MSIQFYAHDNKSLQGSSDSVHLAAPLSALSSFWIYNYIPSEVEYLSHLAIKPNTVLNYKDI